MPSPEEKGTSSYPGQSGYTGKPSGSSGFLTPPPPSSLPSLPSLPSRPSSKLPPLVTLVFFAKAASAALIVTPVVSVLVEVLFTLVVFPPNSPPVIVMLSSMLPVDSPLSSPDVFSESVVVSPVVLLSVSAPVLSTLLLTAGLPTRATPSPPSPTDL